MLIPPSSTRKTQGPPNQPDFKHFDTPVLRDSSDQTRFDTFARTMIYLQKNSAPKLDNFTSTSHGATEAQLPQRNGNKKPSFW